MNRICRYGKEGSCTIANRCQRKTTRGCKIAINLARAEADRTHVQMSEDGTPFVAVPSPVGHFQIEEELDSGRTNLICRVPPTLISGSYKRGSAKLMYITKEGMQVVDVISVSEALSGTYKGYHKVTVVKGR